MTKEDGKYIPVRWGDDNSSKYVVDVDDVINALKANSEKGITKCPFFNEPCLKEGCTSFQYINHCLWDDPNDSRYRAFKKVKKAYLVEGKEEWFAIEIPFCRILDKELPMKVVDIK